MDEGKPFMMPLKIIIISWNVKGMNEKDKKKIINSIIRVKKLTYAFSKPRVE